MKTVRLDPLLEAQVEQAANEEGITVSAFIRRALEKECRTTGENSLRQMLAGIIGSAASGGSDAARDTGTAFKEILAKKRSSQ
jgi:Ribbon-helix-helix protein, copG family.